MIPRPIGPNHFALWTARLELAPSWTPGSVQDIVSEYVADAGTTVVGYHAPEPSALTLLRWPDTREGFHEPSIPECDQSACDLAHRLGALSLQRDIVPDNAIHCMMGRKMAGYGQGLELPLTVVETALPEAHSVVGGSMISARATGDGSVEPYGEPIAAILLDPRDEHRLHALGDYLQQFHYAIERGDTGTTDFFETRHAGGES